MTENTRLNGLQNLVIPAVLNWGDTTPEFCKDIDLILAADCVYLERAFPLLEKTLLDLTLNDVPILMAYKKRRKADRNFFKAIKKNFTVNEVSIRLS